MKKILINHFEKILLVLIAVICFFTIINYLGIFFDKEGDREKIDELKEKIRVEIEQNTEPPLAKIPNYQTILNEKLEGEYVILMKKMEGRIFYSKPLKKKIPIIQKPRFALMPPKASSIKAEGGAKIVKLSFQTDENLFGIMQNKTPMGRQETKFSGHKAEIFAAVIQRKLVHNGKADIADKPWLTLTGSDESPQWAELENPLETEYLLKGTKIDVMDGMGGMSADEGGKKKALSFEFEDADAGEFQTYAYRIAIVAAAQEGIRVFHKVPTAEDLKKDKNAVMMFEKSMYEKGVEFTGNRTVDDEFLKEFGIEQGFSGGYGMAVKSDDPYYLVSSAWSSEIKTEVGTDSSVYLSAVVGKSVSLFIVKDYRYTLIKQDHRGNPIRSTEWARLTVSFLQEIGDRIGKRSNLQHVSGSNFEDKQSRKIDFTTPFVIVEIGQGDRKRVRKKKDWVNVDGKLVYKEVVQEVVEKDINFAVIKNLITEKLEKIWLDPEAIKDIKNEINKKKAEALKKKYEAEKAKKEAMKNKKKNKKEKEPEPVVDEPEGDLFKGGNERSEEQQKDIERRMNE